MELEKYLITDGEVATEGFFANHKAVVEKMKELKSMSPKDAAAALINSKKGTDYFDSSAESAAEVRNEVTMMTQLDKDSGIDYTGKASAKDFVIAKISGVPVAYLANGKDEIAMVVICKEPGKNTIYTPRGMAKVILGLM